MIIEKNFASQVKAIKLEYKTDGYLNNQVFPILQADLHGGLILQMPLINIQEYLLGKVDVNQLLTDDQLVAEL